MLKFSSFIFFVLLINACHSFNNRHDTLAVQCGLNAQTQNRILLRFTNPGGVELAPEQVAQLKVQFQSRDQKEEFLTPTTRACVALPAGEALVKARIQGQAALAAEIKLDAKAATDTIHTVELESPGMLELGLKCPANGLLAASTLGDVVEVKKSLGKLSGYQVAIEVYSASNEKVQDLFLKSMQDTVLEVPHSFDIEGLAEGSYSVRLNVMDSFHGGTNNATDDKCPLTIRRSCAKDEDFDPETVSCVPRLCDNAYRVGAKWTESLAQNRGKGHYECQLVNDKAEKILLSHACQAGYFKGQSTCLAATEISGNCALLETDEVACWGTLLGKDNYPSQKEVNYQTTLKFPEKVKRFGQQCVELESGQVHCWQLEYGDNAHYGFMSGPGTPKTWKDALARGYVDPGQACEDRTVTELDCKFSLVESNEQREILPNPRLGNGVNCLVDIEGTVWCYLGALPDSQARSSSQTAGPFYKIEGIPSPARQARSEGETFCALLMDGSVMCWGNNGVGGAGVNSPEVKIRNPSQVIGPNGQLLRDIKQLSSTRDGSSWRTTYALTRDGRVYAWGSNLDGMLANGTPGEDDEGNPLFSLFAGPVIVELKEALTPPKVTP
jgi:hypothetical protein